MEFVEPDAADLADESGEEVVTDEETDLGTDWETVPSPRFCDIPSQVRPVGAEVGCGCSGVSHMLFSSSSPWTCPRALCRCLSPQPTPEA